MTSILVKASQIFNLRSDTDEEGTVENIRKNVDFHGANAWTLVFAIFIASVGLNVNSAAVIIGAMLISPLMGPILGGGMALAINDYDLLKRSLRNLAIAVFISVVTSTVYFFLSPLDEAHSELLARTQPTVYDVLIALFGGATGIVSASRRERGPAVAGVAIATALMPPLCTAGYGLANGNLKFFAGAFYLFLINSVFIGLSTFVFVRYLKFTKVKWMNKQSETQVNRWVTFIAIAVLIPSLVLAWLLLQESNFKRRATQFIKTEVKYPGTFLISQDLKYNYEKSVIQLNLVGSPLNEAILAQLKDKLPYYNLKNTSLEVQQFSPGEKRDLITGDKQTTELQLQMAELQNQVDSYKQVQSTEVSLLDELRNLFPHLDHVVVHQDRYFLEWARKPSSQDRKKVEGFIQTRTNSTSAQVEHFLKI